VRCLKPAERVGVGDASTTLDVGLDLRGSNPSPGKVPVSRESGGRVEALVDHTGHARLAVSTVVLGTVEPDGCLVLDHDLEDLAGLSLGDWEEAGEERSSILRLAWLTKGRLDNRVVAGSEVELNHVTDLRDDVVGVELQPAAAGNNRMRDARLSISLGGDLGGSGSPGGGSRGNAKSGGNDGKGLKADEHFVVVMENLAGNLMVDSG